MEIDPDNLRTITAKAVARLTSFAQIACILRESTSDTERVMLSSRTIAHGCEIAAEMTSLAGAVISVMPCSHLRKANGHNCLCRLLKKLVTLLTGTKNISNSESLLCKLLKHRRSGLKIRDAGNCYYLTDSTIYLSDIGL